jgi:hypothetical protein
MGFSAPDGGLLAAAAHGFRRPNPQPQLAGSALAGQLLPFTTTYCSVTAGSARLGFRLPFRLHARSDLLQRYYSTYSVRLFALSPAVWNCGLWTHAHADADADGDQA